MTSVTCGLTAEDRDQLRNPSLISSMGATFSTFNPRVFPNEIIGINMYTIGCLNESRVRVFIFGSQVLAHVQDSKLRRYWVFFASVSTSFGKSSLASVAAAAEAAELLVASFLSRCFVNGIFLHCRCNSFSSKSRTTFSC